MTEDKLGQIASKAFYETREGPWKAAAEAVVKEIESRAKKASIREKILSGEPFTGEEFTEECLKIQNEGTLFEHESLFIAGNWFRSRKWKFDGLKIGQKYRMQLQKEDEELPKYVPWDTGDLMRIRRKAFRQQCWMKGDFCHIVGFTAGKYLLLGNTTQCPTFEDLFRSWECSDDLVKWEVCGKLNTTTNGKNS